MKAFLGIDVTFNPENTTQNDLDGMVLRTHPQLIEKLDNATCRMGQALEKSKLPRFFRFIHWLCGSVAAIVGTGVLGALFSGNIINGIRNAGWLYLLGLICFIVWLVLTFLIVKKQDKVLKNSESVRAKTDAETTFDTILTTLGVPLDSEEIDIFSYKYKCENGNIKIHRDALQSTNFLNYSFRIYKDNENLYLANTKGKYAFPLNSIRTIRTMEEDATFPDWHKNESFTDEKYEVYGVYKNKFDVYCAPCYHVLEVVYKGDLMWIYFPNYEISTIEKLTGLNAWGI